MHLPRRTWASSPSLGQPLDGTRVTSLFRRTTRRVGLPGIRFHDLRHTCATILLHDGVHPKVVQEMLGHSTIAITLDTYSHVTTGMHQEASRAMGKALFG
jgi:integrase